MFPSREATIHFRITNYTEHSLDSLNYVLADVLQDTRDSIYSKRGKLGDWDPIFLAGFYWENLLFLFFVLHDNLVYYPSIHQPENHKMKIFISIYRYLQRHLCIRLKYFNVMLLYSIHGWIGTWQYIVRSALASELSTANTTISLSGRFRLISFIFGQPRLRWI